MNIRTKKLLKSIVIAIMLSVATKTMHAEITEVSIRVKGMVCPFCSNAIEKALEEVASVKKVKNIDFKTGIIQIELKPGNKLSRTELESILAKIITEATFKFDGIQEVIESSAGQEAK